MGKLGSARVGTLLGCAPSAGSCTGARGRGVCFLGFPSNRVVLLPLPPSPCTRRQVHSFCNAVGVVTSQIVSVVLAVGENSCPFLSLDLLI